MIQYIMVIRIDIYSSFLTFILEVQNRSVTRKSSTVNDFDSIAFFIVLINT